MIVFAYYVKENLPGSRVAVLYQNDDFGLPHLETFEGAV